MSAEPVAAPVETVTPEKAPRERAPRIDFDSMTVEELKAYLEKPLEKIPMPNKKAMEDAVAKIEAEIAKRRARFDEIKAEKEMIFAGFRLKKAANQESFEARKALLQRRQELSEKRSVALTELKAVKAELETVREAAKNATHIKPAELEEKISAMEMKIECESLNMKEERELRRRIQAMEADLRTAKDSAGIFEKRALLETRQSELKAILDEIKPELDAVYEKLGDKKEKKTEEEKAAEKEERENPINKLNEEWDANKKAIDELYAKRKEVRDEYYAKERVYKDYSFENKRRGACQRALDRKLEELAELEEERKLEEEALKRHPFEKEMNECDTVLAYLKTLLPEEKKAAAKASEIKVPEGMVLLKKNVEEEYFSVAGGKKNKKERRAAKKAAGIVHTLTSLESFSTIRVNAPKTVEEVEETMKMVTARKAFFNALPRGADVDAEIAKLN